MAPQFPSFQQQTRDYRSNADLIRIRKRLAVSGNELHTYGKVLHCVIPRWGAAPELKS